MLNSLIAIGDKIDIRPLDYDGKPMLAIKPYASMLVNIEDDETIHITAPLIQNKIAFLHEDKGYHLCFYTDKGLYQCNCIALDYYKDNKTVVLRVKITSKLVKFQRRKYYRLECVHDIKYRILTENKENRLPNDDNADQKDENMRHNWIKGAIIDISGGGAKLSSHVEHKKGDKIEIMLELVMGKSLRDMVLKAEVIASEKIPERRGRYEHRVQFYNITQKDRDDIIKYIFEQDRKRIKNEKNDKEQS